MNVIQVYKNFIALIGLQATNFILPILTFPYLVRVLGVDKFGVVTYIQTLMLFLALAVDYGFNISATRTASLYANEPKKLSQTFNLVLFTKILLNLFFFAVLSLIFSFSYFAEYRNAYLLGFVYVLGQSLLPTWFFQGVEKMAYIVYINLLAKLIFTIAIFLLIKQTEDYIYVVLLFGLGNLISGIIGIFYIYKKFKLSFFFVKFSKILKELKSNFLLTISTLSIESCKSSGILILGVLVSEKTLGLYSIAERIIRIARQILSVFSQAIYPRVCHILQTSKNALLAFYRKIYTPFLIITITGTFLVWGFSDYIVWIVSGKFISLSAEYLSLASFIPLIVLLNIPAIQNMLAGNHKNTYSTVLILASVLNISLNFLLGYFYGVKGIIVSAMITETFITIGAWFALEYYHPNHAILKSLIKNVRK